MRALAATGHLAEAPCAFRRFQVELRHDTGLTPGPALHDLDTQLFATPTEDPHARCVSARGRRTPPTKRRLMTDLAGQRNLPTGGWPELPRQSPSSRSNRSS